LILNGKYNLGKKFFPLVENKMKCYLVGGAVRDKLLGITPKEHDWLVIGASPEQMLEQKFTPVGKDFPVFLHPTTKEEYALARTERKTSQGYKGFSFFTDENVTIEEDLLRRDLTINAIAEDENGNLIDPFNGQQDIKDKVLRHVSPAFTEDPLRVLRLARFAARFKHLGFSVAEETIALVKEISQSGELDTLVKERIWQELKKAIDSPNPESFIEVLRAGDALKIIFPEIDALFGIPQRAEYHPEIDTGIHVLMCLQQAVKLKANSQTRFAVLVHDLGKATTPKDELPKHIGHEFRSKILVKKMCKRLKVPGKYAYLADVVAENHLLTHTAFELRAATVHKLFTKLSAFSKPENLHNFLIACEADARGRTGFEDQDYPQKDYFLSLYESATSITSHQIDKELFEGKAFGEQLKKLRINAMQETKDNYRNNNIN
jgi:tRNA nucleotidyltransferase (CCA-adding enzyme)